MRMWVLLLAILSSWPVLAAGDEYRFTTPDGRPREYLLSVPARADGAALPLIIVLHGTYGTADKMEKHLGFEPYVERYRVVVAYPDAYRERGARRTLRWNDGIRVLMAFARFGTGGGSTSRFAVRTNRSRRKGWLVRKSGRYTS